MARDLVEASVRQTEAASKSTIQPCCWERMVYSSMQKTASNKDSIAQKWNRMLQDSFIATTTETKAKPVSVPVPKSGELISAMMRLKPVQHTVSAYAYGDVKKQLLTRLPRAGAGPDCAAVRMKRMFEHSEGQFVASLRKASHRAVMGELLQRVKPVHPQRTALSWAYQATLREGRAMQAYRQVMKELVAKKPTVRGRQASVYETVMKELLTHRVALRSVQKEKNGQKTFRDMLLLGLSDQTAQSASAELSIPPAGSAQWQPTQPARSKKSAPCTQLPSPQISTSVGTTRTPPPRSRKNLSKEAQLRIFQRASTARRDDSPYDKQKADTKWKTAVTKASRKDLVDSEWSRMLDNQLDTPVSFAFIQHG